MLLIPDIHINTQYRDSIIQTLSDIIATHPEENNIILLGDYVYMFSYDRDALLALYKLIIGRYHTGKTVYVLAGNHDRHGQHFVYEEARQTRDIISGITSETNKETHTGAIHFITQPEVIQIEGETVAMMPYIIDWSGFTISQGTSPNHDMYVALTQSTNKYEQLSGYTNLALEQLLQNNKITTIIHHYYTANTQLPGLRTQFNYRDVALDKYRLTQPYDIISGHIHHPFIQHRYICCGSLRNTSANESNQCKYYRIKHNQSIQAHQIQVNPYITITHTDHPITHEDITQQRYTIQQQSRDDMKSDYYNITITHTDLNSHRTTITLLTKGQQDIPTLWDDSLQNFKSIKPKYHIDNQHISMAIDNEKINSSIINRQQTLKEYITQKYPEHREGYIQILDEVGAIEIK